MKPFSGGSFLKHRQRLGTSSYLRPGPSTKRNEFGKSALAPAFFLEGSNLSMQGTAGHHRALPGTAISLIPQCSWVMVSREAFGCGWEGGSKSGTFRNPWSEPALANTKNMTLRSNGKNCIHQGKSLESEQLLRSHDLALDRWTTLFNGHQVTRSPGHPKLPWLYQRTCPKAAVLSLTFVRAVEVAVQSGGPGCRAFLSCWF